MAEKETIIKKRSTSFAVRVLLLVLQILLPFGMYFTLVSGQMLALSFIAAVLFISMIVLVGFG